jgi:hypothetical protein
MAYRSPLESRVAKKTTKAITDFKLIEDGDRIMVGLSGGKDSWALLQILDILRQRAPISFSLIAVNVDSGYKDFKHDVIAKTCSGPMPRWRTPTSTTVRGEADTASTSTPFARAQLTIWRTSGRMRSRMVARASTRSENATSCAQDAPRSSAPKLKSA